MFIKNCDKIAMVWNAGAIGYSELRHRIFEVASLFDPETTQKVAIFSPNRPEWVYALYAAWKNRCIAVPLDFMANATEIAYMLNDCRPEVIFYSRETENVHQQAIQMLEYDIKAICLDDLSRQPVQDCALNIEPENIQDTAVIIYTSGTTGSPKGVMLTYDNLLANIEAVSETIPIYTSERSVMVLLPAHHIFPLVGTLIAPLHVGATIAFAPALTSDGIISTLSKNGISIIIGVPRLYAAIRKGIMEKINQRWITRSLFKFAKLINSRSVSRTIFRRVHEKLGGKVEFMVCGGAKLDEDVARDYKALGFEMLEGFGMTEAAPMITFTRPGRWKIGSAGEAMPNLEVKIQDGEITARGRNIMKGYFQRPEETREVLKDGWLFTGDTGHVDPQGFLHITGRKKEILVLSNGKNINPVEIEKKLMSISSCIAEVGVFMKEDMLIAGIYPDFKALQQQEILNLDEYFRWDVIDNYNRNTSSYKKIMKYVMLKEELPKTRLGKVQRFKLAEFADQNLESKKKTAHEPDFEEYHVIRDYLKEQTQGEIHPDDHIEIDLGLDSLDKVSFQTFLQSTFGIDIHEDTFLTYATVEKISQFMREKKNKLSVEAVKWASIFREHVELNLPQRWFTHRLLQRLSIVFLNLYFRLKGEGAENIPQSPFIIAPNHQSYIDGLFVVSFLRYKILKDTYFYTKIKHVKRWWIRAIADRNNVIVMDINRDLKTSLQKLAEVLKSGKNVIIFPEGTRTRTGQIGTFKKTFAILSRELNVPVVPVSIKGAFEAMPRGSKIPRPWKRINVKFHPPIYPAAHDYDTLSDTVYRQLVQDLK